MEFDNLRVPQTWQQMIKVVFFFCSFSSFVISKTLTPIGKKMPGRTPVVVRIWRNHEDFKLPLQNKDLFKLAREKAASCSQGGVHKNPVHLFSCHWTVIAFYPDAAKWRKEWNEYSITFLLLAALSFWYLTLNNFS